MPAAEITVQAQQTSDVDYPRVWLLSLGHFTNDLYGNLLTSLTPYLVLRGEITTTAAGLILLVYLLGSSVLQPVFGAMSDRSSRRLFAVLGPVWVGMGSCLTGWAGNGLMVLGLAAFAGVGTAAFHPQAATMVSRLSGHNKSTIMSIFSLGGNVGFALGPLLAAGIALVGLHYSILALIPAGIVTALLALYTPRLSRLPRPAQPVPVTQVFRAAWRRLSLIVAVIATRSSVQYALIIFLPLYFHARGFSAELGSSFAFIVSLAGAGGGVLGGYLADRYGRRLVVISSLLLSFPLLLAALLATGWVVWPLLAAAGVCLLASNSVTVVQGQELLPANTGMASGLTLGLGFGLSGVIASVLASLADHVGVQSMIFLVPCLAPVAAAMAWFVPDRSAPVKRAV
jgi:FSR family fosmidomycin resistance protein-like MFS transporter